MNYTKPEINILGSSSCAIQGGQKDTSQQVDANPPDFRLLYVTIGAYESDE